jgi:hypothetical protein
MRASLRPRGAVLWKGRSAVEFAGHKIEISTPALVVFVVGCGIFVLPLLVPLTAPGHIQILGDGSNSADRERPVVDGNKREDQRANSRRGDETVHDTTDTTFRNVVAEVTDVSGGGGWVTIYNALSQRGPPSVPSRSARHRAVLSSRIDAQANNGAQRNSTARWTAKRSSGTTTFFPGIATRSGCASPSRRRRAETSASPFRSSSGRSRD